MSNGFRQKPQGSTKDKFRTMETEMKNSQMASRITQMMVQRLLENDKNMAEDVGRLLQQNTELQYKFLALQEIMNADTSKIKEITERMRLKDFTEASDKEDLEKGFTVTDVVADDSTIILTSTTADVDGGIFRSRVKLSETGAPALIQGLMGKGVGTKVDVELNGVMHNIELLGIRKPKAEEALKVLES